MNFWKNTRGAISIFLVIILVPMMTVSALFVDASKISLARSVATSAGDLALNTALTNYDTELKDLYGLFATAQDMDELFDKLEDYYKTCITSTGVSEAEADNYVDQIMAQLSLVAESDDTADILNMEMVDFSISKLSDANLANATVLEKEIVDFMKYRAPINTGLSFLTSLKSFSTLSKQTELVDNRKEYYEAQQGVMERLQVAWNYINEYNKSELVTNGNYFLDMKNNLENYKAKYKEINKKTIMDLYDTQAYVSYNCVVKEVTLTEKNAKGEETSTTGLAFTYNGITSKNYTQYYSKTIGGYDKDNLPNVDNIKSLMSSFYTFYGKLGAAHDDITIKPTGAYELQYLVQNMRSLALPNYTSNVQKMYSTYQQLKNAMIWVEGYDLSTVTDENGNQITAQSIKDTTIKVGGTNKKVSEHLYEIENIYDNVMNTFKSVSSEFNNYSLNVANTNQADYSGVSADVKNIGTVVKGYTDTMEKAADNLEKAVKELESAKISVESGELSQAKATWEQTAQSSELKNTSMAKQDLAEIDQLGSYLNVEEMNKLITVLKNISANLRTTVEQIKGYKFDDAFIGDIQSYDTLKSVIGNKHGDSNLKMVPIPKTELLNQANAYFVWTSGNVNIDWINDSSSQVKLYGVHKTNFYTYLYTHFNSGTVDSGSTEEKEEDPANGENLYANIKSKSDSVSSKEATSAQKGNIENSNEIKDQAELPSIDAQNKNITTSAKISTGDTAAEDTASSLSGMFSELGKAAAGMGEDLRDKLYVADYILSMFSYDTIENEYLVENTDGKAEDITTLTLQPINSTNNFAYGKEVEYIIYGGSNSGNLIASYGSIYGVRFSFNLIYAFMDSSIRDNAFAIATPISAATLGVIPVPLIQAAIIIGIACCESAIDLSDLKAGEKVPLFKTEGTWHCSVKGLVNEAKGIAGEALKYAGSELIDSGYEELVKMLDMTDEELAAYINGDGTGKNVGLVGYVEGAFDTLITRHANTAIQKLTTLCTNAIEANRMDPSMSMKDYVEKGLNDWIANERSSSSADDLSFIVKEEAVKVIIENDFVTKLLEELAVYMTNEETAGSTIDDILSTSPDEALADLSGSLMKCITQMRLFIVDKVQNFTNKIIEYKTKMLSKLEESMKAGADSLKESLNESIDGIFGTGGYDSQDNTGISSLLSFAYSDYLRLFLMVGMYTNEEAIVLRTADVIQVNMNLQQGEGENNYRLKESAVYVKLHVDLQVKPTLLALPLFADTQKNIETNANWYAIQYEDIKGY